MIDKSKLKELALAATPGPWDFDTAETPFRIAGGEVVGGDALPYGDVYTMQEYETPDGSEPLIVAQEIGVANGKFVAAANPAAILELLAGLESARNAALEEAESIADRMVNETDLTYKAGILRSVGSAIRALATTSTEPAKEPASDADIEALRPFAELAELFDPENLGSSMPGKDGDPIMLWPRMHKEYELTVGHLRKAREVLASRGAAQGRITSDNGASPEPSDKPVARLQAEVSGRPYSDGEMFFEVVILDRDRCTDGMELFAAPSASASPAENQLTLDAVQVALGDSYDPERGLARSVLVLKRAFDAEAKLGETYKGIALAGAAPVAGSQQVPEAWRSTLENIAAWLANSVTMAQNAPDDYGPATEFDYHLGQAAAEISQLLAAAAPAVPVPAEQDQARDATRYRWLRDKANHAHFRAPMVFACEANDLITWSDSRHGADLDDAVDVAMEAMAAPSLQQPKTGSQP